ncbi:DMT family transporter [Aureisphaera galaxeae]|uniref:DMT family transporter n=1 Tax=Aureisphaera galaxeae TaxID=1538023 RepID=UPI00234FEC6B|nr:DMT family transporter [Aureisphaera galaxeae]MDC8005653.1 DMT family transporter [Aureisphaera galaxeae]
MYLFSSELLRGILYILIATFAFAWMNLLAKYLSEMHPLQVVFFRAFGTFAFIFPYMLYKKIPVVGKEVFWLSVRGVIGFISLAAFFMVIQRIPLGPAISIRYIGPAFSVVLAVLFLREKVKTLQWFCLLIAIAGVFILKGADFRIDEISFLLALLSAVLVGAVFTLVRYLGPKEHALTIINYFMIASILGSLFFIGHWRMPLGMEWTWVILIGIFGLIGQVFMTRAFQLADTNTIAPFKYMELVYALGLGLIFLDEEHSYMALFGMLLIIVGMVLNVYAKNGMQKPKEEN